MPSSLDALPPPNRTRFRKIIRNKLKDVIRSLSAFSASVRAGRKPDWSSSATLELFTAQLAAFRLISNRRTDARPIELVRDMDHQWTGLRLEKTLAGVVSALNAYSGKSVLGNAFVEVLATGDFQRHPIISLVLGRKTATAADLPTLLALAPTSFKRIDDSLSDLSSSQGHRVLGSSSKNEAREALALSVQEYLKSEHLNFLYRQTIALPLRKLLYELNDPSIRKHLFGCSPEEIEAWEMLDIKLQREKKRALQRNRSARCRAKHKTKSTA